MSSPLRIDCSTAADVPDVERLALLATGEHHVVLQFETTMDAAEKRAFIDRLSSALPEFSVFDSGGFSGKACVTIMQVIQRSVVVAHAEQFVAAAREFRRLAASLCESLAARKQVPASELVGRCRGSGRLEGEWSYAFHGLQCRFRHTKTGQVVDVEIAFGDEFGVLDPQFFGQFIQSTSQFKPLGRLLRDPYHDGRRVLQVLEQSGRLERVTAERLSRKTGLVAR